MIQWLSKKVQDPIIPIDEARVASFQTDSNVNIVFYGDINSPQGTILLNFAKTDDYNSTSNFT